MLVDSRPAPWFQNLSFVLLGFALGLIAEWVKTWYTRRYELNLAKREIYDELATYIAQLEQAYEGKGEMDFTRWKRIRTSAPKLEIINWYKANRLDVLLRVDPRKGIRRIHEELSAAAERIDPADRSIRGQDSLLALVRSCEDGLDSSYLRRRIEFAHKRLAEQTRAARSVNS